MVVLRHLALLLTALAPAASASPSPLGPRDASNETGVPTQVASLVTQALANQNPTFAIEALSRPAPVTDLQVSPGDIVARLEARPPPGPGPTMPLSVLDQFEILATGLTSALEIKRRTFALSQHANFFVPYRERIVSELQREIEGFEGLKRAAPTEQPVIAAPVIEISESVQQGLQDGIEVFTACGT